MALSGLLILLLLAPLASAQDWSAMEPETLRHFQAMVRLDSSGPPHYESKLIFYSWRRELAVTY